MRLLGSTGWGHLLVALAALWLAPAGASAQGAGIHTQSGCMTGRNGAGVAHPCQDGSAVYYNPAALVRENGAVSFGVTVIDQAGSFVHDTTGTEVTRVPGSMIVPHGWATYRLSERIGLGLGVWQPYGLSVDWPVCPPEQPRCGTGFEGRFAGYAHSLRGVYLQPTIAYDVIPGRLSIGVGVDLVKGDIEIRRRLDLAEQTTGPFTFSQLGIAQGTDFADVRIAGDGWGVTGHVGALFRVSNGISVGARYLHSVELALDGTADFTQVPTFLTVGPLGTIFPTTMSLDDFIAASGVFEPGGVASDQDFSTSITLPAQAVAGIALQLDPTLRVLLDYQWTQWSQWDQADVDFGVALDERLILDFEDAGTVRFGVDYALSDRVTVRGGFTLAEAAARDASVSPFLPDSERALFGGGMSYRASERLSLDVVAMTMNAASRRGRLVRRESIDETAEQLNGGLYSSDGQLFGATVTYHFGGTR
ncbi:MAG TPA: outer membrane protein transport protein [Longimicrobiales bacterium]|nr:outer membrane protein transport protein [Longimicrobiales bacterium]